MKIIFINFQSGMNMSKGYLQYFTNGWKYIFPHNSDSLKNVIEFINKEKPDIVTFAEIDGKSWRSKNVNQIQLISEQTGLEYNQFFPTRTVGNCINQGNAIISKYELSKSKQVKLPGYGENRYLCSSEINLNEKVIKLYTTHLSTNKQINIVQRWFIANKLKNEKYKTILMGDFNISKKYLGVITEQTCLKDINFDKTFPSWNPKHTLDHIFVDTKIQVDKSNTYDKNKFSDHIPIGVEINI